MPYGPAFVPQMSAANTPYDFNITASGTYSTYSPWCAFNRLSEGAANRWAVAATTGWLKVECKSRRAVTRYLLRAQMYDATAKGPTGWTFEGSNDDSNWDTLDTVAGRTWALGQRYIGSFSNTTRYQYYRWNFTGSEDATYLVVGEAQLYESSDATFYNLIPPMGTDTHPSGTCSASNTAIQPAWKAFLDHVTLSPDAANRWVAQVTSGQVGYQFASGQVVTAYSLQTQAYSTDGPYAPKTWTFQGSNDGSSWDTLDTQTNITDWAALWACEKFFIISNTTSYTYYRLNFSASNHASYTAIQNFKMYGGTIAADAIQCRSTAYVNYSSSSSISVGKPTGLAEGDLMLFWIAIDDMTPGTVTAVPSGFTFLQTVLGTYVSSHLYWKFATATEVAASSFSATLSAAKSCFASMSAFTGVHTTSPFVGKTVRAEYWWSAVARGEWRINSGLWATGTKQLLVSYSGQRTKNYRFNYRGTCRCLPHFWTQDFHYTDNSTKTTAMAHGQLTGTGSIDQVFDTEDGGTEGIHHMHNVVLRAATTVELDSPMRYRSWGYNKWNTTGATAVPKPPDIEVGDLLIFLEGGYGTSWDGLGSARVFTRPSGLSLLNSIDTGAYDMRVYTKTADADDVALSTFDYTNYTSMSGAILIAALKNVEIVDQNIAATNVSTTTHTFSALDLTSTGDNDYALLMLQGSSSSYY